MKTARCWVPVLLWACAGCFTLPTSWPGGPPPDLEALRARQGPVTAEQVNEQNARDKAKALRDEIERDARADAAATDTPAKKARGPDKDKKRSDDKDKNS